MIGAASAAGCLAISLDRQRAVFLRLVAALGASTDVALLVAVALLMAPASVGA